MPEMYELSIRNLRHLDDLYRECPGKGSQTFSQSSGDSQTTTNFMKDDLNTRKSALPNQHPDYLMTSSLQDLFLSVSNLHNEEMDGLKSHRKVTSLGSSGMTRLSDVGSSLGSSEQLYCPEEDAVFPSDLEYGLIHVEVIPLNNDKIVWETHHIALERVEGLGFGVAISGGQDNPHFTSGETSIVVSDVLKGGPADGKLKNKDRIISINGISMDDVNHGDAIALLRSSGNMVDLFIKRKVHIPSPHRRQEKVVAIEGIEKDKGLGMELGCKFYVKNLKEGSVSAEDGEIERGDFILKINEHSTESLSLAQTQRLLERTKGKVQLTLERPPKSITSACNRPQSEGYSSAENVYQWTLQQQQQPDQRQRSVSNLSTHSAPLSSSTHYYRSRSGSKLTTSGEDNSRCVAYKPDGSGIGISLAGGNSTGVYISAVEGGSTAQCAGLSEGDFIIQINGVPVHSLTREQVVRRLNSLPEDINLLVVERLEEYSRLFTNSSSDSGDEFYIKANFTYKPMESSPAKLSVQPGDIFRVTDTYPNNSTGLWIATKMSANGEPIEAGVIPSRLTAHKLFGGNLTRSTNDLSSNSKHVKSFGRDQWNNLVLDTSALYSQRNSAMEVYDMVKFQETDFTRPVILYGALADLCQEKLLTAYPTQFELPSVCRVRSGYKTKSLLKVEAIRNIINRGKHCILDLPPHCIEKLVQHNLHPIVVHISSDTADLKDSKLRSGIKKMDEITNKIEAKHPQLSPISVQIQRGKDWLQQVYDVIVTEQEKPVWCTSQSALDRHASVASLSDYLSLSSHKMYSSKGNLSRAHYCSQTCLDQRSPSSTPSGVPSRGRSSTNPARLTEEPHSQLSALRSPLSSPTQRLTNPVPKDNGLSRRRAVSDVTGNRECNQYLNRAFVEDEAVNQPYRSRNNTIDCVPENLTGTSGTSTSRPSSVIWFTDRSCSPHA